MKNEIGKRVKQPTREEKRKKITSRVVLIVVLIVALLSATALAGYLVFDHYYGKLNYKELDDDYEINTDVELAPDKEKPTVEEATEEEIAAIDENVDAQSDLDLDFDDKNVLNILLVGTDNRSEDTTGSRTDSIMICSINRDTKKITLSSVMRDTYVDIPNVGHNRINAAFSYGGIELLLDTIELNYGIPIDKYMLVDFYSFIDIVDKMGGVTVTVSAAEIKVMQMYIKDVSEEQGIYDYWDEMISTDQAGTVHLSGAQALAYARVRYVGNADFDRTKRQRTVISALFDQVKELSLSEIQGLADEALPLITTNLTESEALGFVLNAATYLDYDMMSFRMPMDGTYENANIRGMSVLSVDFDTNSNAWYETVYNGSTDYIDVEDDD